MRVFLDTNILLDVLEQRQPHHHEANDVMERCTLHQWPAFMAWHSLATAFYVLSRKIGEFKAQTALEELIHIITVAYTGQNEAAHAFTLGFTDLEDALQSVAAEACSADCIVTRNETDFVRSPIPVLSPTEFLARFPVNAA